MSASPKRPHEKDFTAFPDDITIPPSALADRKFRSSYVYVLNDPRVYKRRRLNGDRTSSRLDPNYDIHIKVVFNEPVPKRKSILASTHSPKEESSPRKSVSFLSKITFIDSNDLDGGSSDWTDVDLDDSQQKSKPKMKNGDVEKNGKVEREDKNGKRAELKKVPASNGQPSSKNTKVKTKNKSSSSSSSTSKNGHSKTKPVHKELFKFKITKPFRKHSRSKIKKLSLQKKFGRRMFKAFVQVKRSFNLKNIPDNVTVPLEKITLKASDVITPQKQSVQSIQEFLIGKVTKTVKVNLTPVQHNVHNTSIQPVPIKIDKVEVIEPMTICEDETIVGDAAEPMINGEQMAIDDAETITDDKIESNSSEKDDDRSSRTDGDIQSDNPVVSQEMVENCEANQNVEEISSTETSDTNHQTVHGGAEHEVKSDDGVTTEVKDSSDVVSV